MWRFPDGADYYATLLKNDRFDIRAFHDVVLRNGPVPLDLLDMQVTRWIESQRASAM